MARRGAYALLLLCIVLLNAAVDARELLHKHHKEGGKHKHWKGKEHGGHKHWKKGKEHGHHHMHDGPCKPIARVLHETPSLKRFAQAFDEAHVSYLQGLFWDPHAEATFLVVPDTHLGSGDTVFDEAPIRFQQHTMLKKVKTCKAKNGDTYDTLANTTLTVLRDSPAGRGGRKLQQLSTAWTTLLDELLPASSEAVPGGDRPVSNAAFATLPADTELPLDQLRGGPRFSETPGWQGPRDGPRGGPHGGPDGGPGDAPRDAPHVGPHGPHGPHGGPRGPHDSPHDGHSVEDVVAHAFKKAEKKAAKHGAIYLQSNTTSQRIKVLASVRACEGTVLFVSAFLNAPPTPEPVALERGQQRHVPRKRQVHGHGHWEEHRHHHGHRHGLLHRVKHAFAHLSERVLHFFNPHHPDCKRHAKKQHFEEPETHILGLPEQPVDPELLAFYAAHERAAGSEAMLAMEITQEQTDFEGTLAMPAVIAGEGIAEWSEEPRTVEGSANLHERAWAAVADPHPAAVSAVAEESLPADHAFPFGAAVEALDAEAESVAIDAEAADAEFATNVAAAAVAESVASWEPEQRVYDSVSGEEREAPEASWLPAAVADAFGTLEDSAERLAERLHLYGIV